MIKFLTRRVLAYLWAKVMYVEGAHRFFSCSAYFDSEGVRARDSRGRSSLHGTHSSLSHLKKDFEVARNRNSRLTSTVPLRSLEENLRPVLWILLTSLSYFTVWIRLTARNTQLIYDLIQTFLVLA